MTGGGGGGGAHVVCACFVRGYIKKVGSRCGVHEYCFTEFLAKSGVASVGWSGVPYKREVWGSYVCELRFCMS